MSELQFKRLPDTAALDESVPALVIIDQTKLPNACELLSLTKREEIWDAIKTLKVRGAPAIGVSAAIALYVTAVEILRSGAEGADFGNELQKAADYYATSRPTAVNLFWALNRMTAVAKRYLADGHTAAECCERLKTECIAIRDEDVASSRAIGENGLKLLHDGDGVLTHCNAGQLATIRYGTALAPLHVGKEKGMTFHVFCDETRPLLQGARLSAYELSADGIDTTVICDNMASSLMKTGRVQAVIVGADRIAHNGDTANKIGTSGVAILAAHYGVPFYVAAPLSTIDRSLESGAGIPIEQRRPDEVTEMWYRARMAPEGVSVYNPAFDVTANSLITAIITEKGVLRAPYRESIDAAFER